MIFTKNWLQEFIEVKDIKTDDIASALNSIGLEVASVENINIPDKVVVGKVIKCEKHPDANKLNICQVDIGQIETLQIVCGAKNVREDLYVAVAVIGAKLGEDFKITKSKLRGEDSFGMLCGADEIGLVRTNDGLIELDNSIGELTLGKSLNEYEVFNDTIIEVELTANRGDCLSVHGIARDLSAFFKLDIKKQNINIDFYDKNKESDFSVEFMQKQSSNLIYNHTNLEQLKTNLFYQTRLSYVGIDTTSKVQTYVDYAKHSTGVLLNAYETNEDNSLKISTNEHGFDTVTQNEKTLSTIGINAEKITKNCDDMLLEASYIDPEYISKKVFETKQKTSDIYYNSSRGSEPDLEFGIDYLLHILSVNGAKIYKKNELFINSTQNKTIDFSFGKINKIIGENIDKDKVIAILTSLKLNIKTKENGKYEIFIPTFRHDIKNIADVSEEVLRIIGIDNIKAKPMLVEDNCIKNENISKLDFIHKLRQKSAVNNFFETLTFVFTSKELIKKYNFSTVQDKLDILNPITNDLDTLKTTNFVNLAQAVSQNVKHGYKSIPFFEICTIFNEKREEKTILSFIYSGQTQSQNINNNGKPQDVDFYTFSQKITNCVGDFELAEKTDITNSFFHPYQCADMIKNGKTIGLISKIHPSVADDFDISENTFVAQIDIDMLNEDTILATEISKYQVSKRDLAIIAPKSMKFDDIYKTIQEINIPEIRQFNLIDIYNDETLEQNESLTIRFVLQSNTQTLQEAQINDIMDKILDTLKEKLNIGIR